MWRSCRIEKEPDSVSDQSPSGYVEQAIPGLCAGDGEDGRAAEVLGEEQGGASVSDCEGFVWLSQDGVSRFVKEPDPSVHSVWQRESVDVELGGEAKSMRESRGYCAQKRAGYPPKRYRRGFYLNFS